MANFVSCCLRQHDADTISEPVVDTYEQDVNYGVPVLRVLSIDVCARAILDHVPLKELVRSERVCRRWQIAIHEYMHSIYTVSFYDISDRDTLHLAKYGSSDKSESNSYHRRIQISSDTCSVSFACAIIEKWGRSIVTVFTSRQVEEYFDLISLKCKYLHCIKFVGQRKRKNLFNQIFQGRQSGKQIVIPVKQINKCKHLKKIAFKHIFDLGDDDMAIILKNIDFEELEICNIRLYGDSLLEIKPNSLKSLNISCMWTYFLLNCLVCATKNMQNLKSLTLDNNYLSIFTHAHLILNEMPELEHISLCHYYYDYFELRWDNDYQTSGCIESLCRLDKLKRLYLKGNETVDDEMLEELVKCKSLEYLDISNDAGRYTFWSERGVAALCRRPRPAVTTLCFGYIQNMPSSDLLLCIRNIKMPMVEQLETIGCVEFTPQWLEEASRASMKGTHPLEVQAISLPALKEEFHPDLKIVLSGAEHNQ
ncbi:uncharacterized protein LOC134665386 [Cydia fagiglandana]|uniref:uncharacterized protein LOC134665386 n=1 Tax=Cydia fagiglandana TaxID=1458189 RepID=UPI002FEE2D2C